MIPLNTVEELNDKHSSLEKDLSSGNIDKRFFAEMFDVIFNKRISHDEIVENVEAFDLWWNS